MSASAQNLSQDERTSELKENLSHVNLRVQELSADTKPRTLVAVSKYKPASDVRVCYEHGQLDFGENYVQELVDKAAELPREIRWHFIGTLQSNKAKTLAAIPNLHTIQTLTSSKAAAALNKVLPEERTQSPLNILIQINTSGETSKSGLSPLSPSSEDAASGEEQSDLTSLASFIIKECPKLRFQGLMTIGALEQSLDHDNQNRDFEKLIQTRDGLDSWLKSHLAGQSRNWGDENGRLLLSMGMSSDFEDALRAGSDIVRVGTGIFGARRQK
jgi:pyridoxal phosphate enzyme (YggS family)